MIHRTTSIGNRRDDAALEDGLRLVAATADPRWQQRQCDGYTHTHVEIIVNQKMKNGQKGTARTVPFATQLAASSPTSRAVRYKDLHRTT